MTWRRKSTSIDVDLDQFSAEQLLQGLIDEGWLTEAEANEIQQRHGARNNKTTPLSFGGVPDEFRTAQDYLRRGMRDEALLHLERGLGRDWIGVLQ